MKVLDLFCGTKSVSRAFEARGHEAAPRGSQTGTQRSHNKVDKARIPKLLCEHIVDICEEGSDAIHC